MFFFISEKKENNKNMTYKLFYFIKKKSNSQSHRPVIFLKVKQVSHWNFTIQ